MCPRRIWYCYNVVFRRRCFPWNSFVIFRIEECEFALPQCVPEVSNYPKVNNWSQNLKSLFFARWQWSLTHKLTVQ